MGTQETIVRSAIWFDDGVERAHLPNNIKTGIVVCGLRHCNCFTVLADIYPDLRYKKEGNIQGFLTSKNEFVSRQVAATIAISSGQINELRYLKPNKLDSSDIF